MDPSLEKIEQEGQGRRYHQKEVSYWVIANCFVLDANIFAVTLRARRVVKTSRAIVGATLDDIKAKKAAAAKAQKATSAATEAALKEVKSKTKTQQTAGKSVHGHMNAAVPKHQQSGTFNARGGSRR